LLIINVSLHFQTEMGKAKAGWGSDINTATRVIIQSCRLSLSQLYTLAQTYTLFYGAQDTRFTILTFKIRHK
jgi:hypothetical protein